jgi:surfeit locus 1 family protein
LRLLWPGLITLLLAAATTGLGVWQVQRLHWKTALLADIARAEAAPPEPLPANPAPFAKVELTGRLRDDLASRYGVEVRHGTLGAQLLTPLERQGEDPVLVDRGWLPGNAPVPPTPDNATVVGYVRPAEHGGIFTPAAEPAARHFYALDPATIGAALGLGRVAPFTVVALGPTGAMPEPARDLPRPPNDHLQYALTWFGLAAASIGVFVAYARKTLSG